MTANANALQDRRRWLTAPRCALGLLALCLIAGTARAATPEPPSADLPGTDPDVVKASPEAFRSVFELSPQLKDPFFPDSKRRVAKPVKPKPKVTRVHDTPEGLFALMQLKGISLARNKRLALINRYTFSEGEEVNVKIDDTQVIKVRCVTINDRSVVISIKGKTKELKLRNGL